MGRSTCPRREQPRHQHRRGRRLHGHRVGRGDDQLFALLVAAWRYDVHLSFSLLLAPAVVLCALMAITVGYGMALAISNPMVTNVVTNALIFVVLLFSPIVYPVSQLPRWFAEVHYFLPFYNMAVVIRAGLTSGVVAHVATWFVVMAAWTAAGGAATAWVVGRRR